MKSGDELLFKFRMELIRHQVRRLISRRFILHDSCLFEPAGHVLRYWANQCRN